MRYKKLYPPLICFCVFLGCHRTGAGRSVHCAARTVEDHRYGGRADQRLREIAGVSAAWSNSALVTLVSLLLLYLSKEPPNGFTLVELG